MRPLLRFLCLSLLFLAAPGVVVAASGEATYQSLSKGNQAFVEGHMNHPQQSPARRQALVSGQQPPAIVLSCADSRVPPELVFDQGLGDLFVVRVAGNILNQDNLASIEYAYSQLGSTLIVVLGHDSCGAVRAAVETPAGQSAGSSHLDALVANIRASIQAGGATLPTAPYAGKLDPLIRANVLGVVKDLTRKSPIIAQAVQTGKLLIIPALYSLGSGVVIDLRSPAP